MGKVIGILLFMVVLLGVLAAFVVASEVVFTPSPVLLQGEINATQIEVAAKIFGRIETQHVKEGDPVKKGQVLISLNSPEITAKVAQASAVKDAATAQREKSDHGARKQEIEAALHAWQMAMAVQDLAKKTYERVAKLYENDNVPLQSLDEAMAKWKASTQQADAAHAVYNMAMEGARVEDKAAAQAIERQATGVVTEAQSYLKETEMLSPIDGEVVEIIADPGELITPGYPVVSIIDLNDTWAVFNVREDFLAKIKMGSVLKAKVPALGENVLEFKVDYIKALGEFATWRATKASGDFDLKTFEVRARPVGAIDGLRPGMSAIITWDTPAPPKGFAVVHAFRKWLGWDKGDSSNPAVPVLGGTEKQG